MEQLKYLEKAHEEINNSVFSARTVHCKYYMQPQADGNSELGRQYGIAAHLVLSSSYRL